jgi:hypothetical protein
MLHLELLARAIHDDRVREIERASRVRWLLRAPDEAETAAPKGTLPARSLPLPGTAARSGSTCEPA